jgi:hypothetical protein
MDWQPAQLIPAGGSHAQYVEWWYDWGDNGDCGAEATYELVGSPVPSSFTLQARQHNGKNIRVQYHDQLISLGSPENSLIDLGFDWDGAVQFVLAGDGTMPYVGTNPPVTWMQATLPTIGDKSLREITMPLSHDAGMSEIRDPLQFSGVQHNVCTQTGTVGQQLIYGARWFDIRPFKRNGSWFTGHFSQTLGNIYAGGTGRSIDNIIRDINTFTSQNPGELIVLELTHELIFDKSQPLGSQWAGAFKDSDWLALYDKLAGINDLWTISDDTFEGLPSDLTAVLISTFIQPGSKSAVLIRIPDSAPLATGPQAHAFIHESRLAWTGAYSNTNDPTFLSLDQLAKLASNRPFSSSPRDHPPLRSTWTITQKGLQVTDVATESTSIIGLANVAQRRLIGDLWGALSVNSYPNLIEVDNVHNSQIAGMCVAINERYAKKGVVKKENVVLGRVGRVMRRERGWMR